MAVSQSEVLFKDRSTYLLLKEGVETATSVLVDPSLGLLIVVEPRGSTNGGREPDLSVGGLFVYHVGAVAFQGERQNTAGKSHVGLFVGPGVKQVWSLTILFYPAFSQLSQEK